MKIVLNYSIDADPLRDQLEGLVSRKAAARFDASLVAIHLLCAQQPAILTKRAADKCFQRLTRSIQCAVTRYGARN